MPDQPNVLFVFSDQHRGMDIGCTGNEDVQTPNLDRLAGEGTRFSNTYANYPLCGPSRACILSGQYPQTSGMVWNDLQLPTDVPSVAEEFREAGYRTGYVGKWHLDGVPRDKFTPPGPRRRGFDDYWAVYNCSHDYYGAKYYANSPEPIEIDGYEPEIQTDLAIDFIERDDDRPFCLFVSYGPPHDPYRMVPEKYRKEYHSLNLDLRSNVSPILPHKGHPAPTYMQGPPVTEWVGDIYQDVEWYDYDFPEEGYADYYAAITAIDAQIGRLMESLDDTEITDSTVLVYTSDHGDMLWSQGRNQKGQPYEESINVPFLVRWPERIPAGEVSEQLLSTVDFAPSLLGLADVSVPRAMEGTDLSPAMVGDSLTDPPESVYLGNVYRGWRGVRTEQYTYARLREDEFEHLTEGHWLLFDNEADPYQRTNLVYDRDYREALTELSRLTEDWIEAVDGSFRSLEELVVAVGVEEDWQTMVDTRLADKADF